MTIKETMNKRLDQEREGIMETTDKAIEAGRACEFANRLRIYAVPSGNHWFPQFPNGGDPPVDWEIDNQPTIRGWPTWQSAVVSLGEYLDSQAEDDE